jgi:hypothetical protein
MMLTRPANRGVGRFDGHPKVEILPCPPNSSANYLRARLLEDLPYTTCEGLHVVTPIGLIGDGASIPPEAQIAIGFPLSSQNAAFGFTHDGLYRLGGFQPDQYEYPFNFVHVTKEQADLYAEDMALCSGHSPETARAIYLALAQFGGAAWRENAAKREACGDLRNIENFTRLLEWA